MKKIVRIYKNSKSFENTLFVYLNDKTPTNVVDTDTVTTLFFDDEVIGYNIFGDDFNDYSDGYIRANKELIDKINIYLEKENISVIDADLNNYIVVGELLELEKIENTKLTKCQVDIKDKVIQVVCGAQNLAIGSRVAVALPNSVVLGNLIKEGQLNGVDSFGMICSSYELGLTKTKTKGTILILDSKHSVGSNLEEVAYV